MAAPTPTSTVELLNKPSRKAVSLPSTTSAEKAKLYEELEHMFAERDKLSVQRDNISSQIDQQTESIVDKIITSTFDRMLEKVKKNPHAPSDCFIRMVCAAVTMLEADPKARDVLVSKVNKFLSDKNIRVLEESFALEIAIRDLEKKAEKEVINVFVDVAKFGAEMEAKKGFTEMFADDTV